MLAGNWLKTKCKLHDGLVQHKCSLQALLSMSHLLPGAGGLWTALIALLSIAPIPTHSNATGLVATVRPLQRTSVCS